MCAVLLRSRGREWSGGREKIEKNKNEVRSKKKKGEKGEGKKETLSKTSPSEREKRYSQFIERSSLVMVRFQVKGEKEGKGKKKQKMLLAWVWCLSFGVSLSS